MKKRIAAIICAAVMVIPLVNINAEYNDSDVKKAIVTAANWKNEYDNPLYSAGTNSSNLYITALSRLGVDFDYNAYLNSLDTVALIYGPDHNAADMQRSVIATVAAGGDAQNIGGRDLVADSTYYRDATSSLGKDGINAYSWALIALDSGDFSTPDWSIANRDQIIATILSCQDADGSFLGDIYSTASAITALAPYISTSGAYTVTQNQTGYTFDISPKDAVENAIAYLSEMQMKDGDWGDLNSTAMVNIALDSVGIDSENDPNFVARNGSAFDGLMAYRNDDGSFSYAVNESDGEATSYAICAMVSHLARKQGNSGIFAANAADKVGLVFQTAAPAATQAPSSSSSQSSSNAPAATKAPTATKAPAATNSTTATRAPQTSSGSTSKVTPRPVATPRTSTVPSNTMRPTRTAAPIASSSPAPASSTKPVSSPRPTKRPALVGPVEMPGPMPTSSPSALNAGLPNNGTTEKPGTGTIVAIVSITVLLLAAAAVALFIWKNKKAPVPVRAIASRASHENYKAKQHRRTEEHMRFEQRERYKERLKYRGKHN